MICKRKVLKAIATVTVFFRRSSLAYNYRIAIAKYSVQTLKNPFN